MILDTNALSALAEKDSSLIEKISNAPRLYVTLVSLGEFAFGIRGSRRRKELEGWLERALERVIVLSPSMETLPFYADVRAELKKSGTPIPANVCWIAALVRQHKMKIVSRDQHFDKVKGVRRLEW